VLTNAPDAPADLRARALAIAGAVLELAGKAAKGAGAATAAAALDDGRAWAKFQRICEAQGGMREPPTAPLTRAWTATRSGSLTAINNRKISRLAKLAGAPDDPAAGVVLHARLGAAVSAGAPLLTIHAEAPGQLEYALDYAGVNLDMFEIEA
jgi:thymidine phosphorylase